MLTYTPRFMGITPNAQYDYNRSITRLETFGFTAAHNDPCVVGVADAMYISLHIYRRSSNAPFSVHISCAVVDAVRNAIDDDEETMRASFA